MARRRRDRRLLGRDGLGLPSARENVTVQTLEPGSYTAIARGVGATIIDGPHDGGFPYGEPTNPLTSLVTNFCRTSALMRLEAQAVKVIPFTWRR